MAEQWSPVDVLGLCLVLGCLALVILNKSDDVKNIFAPMLTFYLGYKFKEYEPPTTKTGLN